MVCPLVEPDAPPPLDDEPPHAARPATREAATASPPARTSTRFFGLLITFTFLHKRFRGACVWRPEPRRGPVPWRPSPIRHRGARPPRRCRPGFADSPTPLRWTG